MARRIRRRGSLYFSMHLGRIGEGGRFVHMSVYTQSKMYTKPRVGVLCLPVVFALILHIVGRWGLNPASLDALHCIS